MENIEQATAYLKHAVDLYNNDRPHLSIGLLTPNTIHQNKESFILEKIIKNLHYVITNTIIVTKS